jgi:hypothetical protein
LRFFSQAPIFPFRMADDDARPKHQDPPPAPPGPDPLDRLRGARYSGGDAGRSAGFGVQFAGAILLFLYAGNWVDGKLGTGPLFLILGVFLGAGASFYSIYRRLMEDQKAANARKGK